MALPWVRALWLALLVASVASTGTKTHPFIWFAESFASDLSSTFWNVPADTGCFNQANCGGTPCGALNFALSGSSCYLTQSQDPIWTLPQGYSGSISVRVDFGYMENAGECCIGRSDLGVKDFGYVQGGPSMANTDFCTGMGTGEPPMFYVADETFFFYNESVSTNPELLGISGAKTSIAYPPLMGAGSFECPQPTPGDISAMTSFTTTLTPSAEGTVVDMTMLSASVLKSSSKVVTNDTYPTQGQISWIRIGTAGDAVTGVSPTQPQFGQIRGVTILLKAQCLDGNDVTGDGCSSTLVEPFWFCQNDGSLGSSVCYDATNATELRTLNLMGVVKRNSAFDANSILYPGTFDTVVKGDVGLSSASFNWPWISCTTDDSSRACADSNTRRMAGAFINGTWTPISSNDLTFPTPDTVTVNLIPYGGPFYPGTTVRFVWWSNVIEFSSDLGYVTLDGPLLAATPVFNVTHFVPIVVNNSASAAPLVAPCDLQTLSFKSNLQSPELFDFWLYEGPTTFDAARQFDPADPNLKAVHTVHCSNSGVGPWYVHQCNINVTAPTNKAQPAYLVGRVSLNSARLGAIMKLHPVISAPEVDPIALPIAQDVMNGFTITGQYWPPAATFSLLAGGVVISARLESNSSSSRSYNLTAPMSIGELQVIISLYQFSNTFTIGTTRKSPPTVTNTGVVRYNLESTYLMINGTDFAELDPIYNSIVLSQDDSNVPVCTPVIVTQTSIKCDFNDPSHMPTEGTIYAKVSTFGGHYSAPSSVGLYIYVSQAWPYLIFQLNSTTGVPSLTNDQLSTLRTDISALLGLSPSSLLLRVSYSQKRSSAAAAQLQIYFTTAASQSLFQSSALSANTTVQNAVNSYVAEVSSNSISSSYLTGTAVFIATQPLQEVQPPTVTNNNGVSASSGLDAGAIAGIIVGIVAAVAIVVIIVIISLRRRLSTLNRLKAAAEKVPEEMRSMFSIKSGDIELGKKLGEGSFGAVFQGTYKGKQVAVKKLVANVLSSQITEFFREASLMMGIQPHRNVVRTYGMCQEFGNFSMVLEFLEGGSLDGWLHKNSISPSKPMDEVQLYKFARGIALGMRHLARSHIVHRDLAARNILLSADLTPKISDFGFSRVVGDDQQGKTQSDVGPIRWMSPENLSSKEYSEKSDVWSYGALLIELITGREPFPDEDMLSVAVGVRDSKFTAIDYIPKDCPCPSWTMNLIQMCFTVVVNERPNFDGIVKFLDKCRPSGAPVDPEEDDVEQDIAVQSTATNKRKAAPAAASPQTVTSRPIASNYSDASVVNEIQVEATSANSPLQPLYSSMPQKDNESELIPMKQTNYGNKGRETSSASQESDSSSSSYDEGSGSS